MVQDITERKQMEDKLAEYARNLEGLVEERTEEVSSERQRLYNVLETLPAYVVLLDSDYRVPFANKVFRELFGDSKGRRCHEFLFQRDSPCENCETYKVLKNNKPHHWEWTGPNGRDYDIYDFPFIEADGSIRILEMGLDITERKQAEKQLYAASLYSRSLIDASLDPLVTINAEGKITDVNKATELATGFSRKQLVGTDFSDYFTEPEKANSGYKQVFTKGFVRDYPLAIRHTSGKITEVLYNATVYTNDTGEIQGVFAAARDVTDRKKAELAVQVERKRFYDVLETVPIMVCLLSPDYHVIFANRSFREKFGESNGKHCYEYCFGSTEPCKFCESYTVLKTRKPYHWEVNSPDGSVIDAYAISRSLTWMVHP